MARRPSESQRIRNLIALDARALMARLEARKDDMIAMFSLHRDREPLLSPLRSWVPSASFQDMAVLSPREQGAVAAFYEALDSLRWYFRYTSDMPGAAQRSFALHRKALRAAHEALCVALGPRVPEVVEAVATEAPPVAKEPARPRRRRRSKR